MGCERCHAENVTLYLCNIEDSSYEDDMLCRECIDEEEEMYQEEEEESGPETYGEFLRRSGEEDTEQTFAMFVSGYFSDDE